MYIDISNNTSPEPIELWVAQRMHHFTIWWTTFIGVQFLLGIQLIYIAVNVNLTTSRNSNDARHIMLYWRTIRCCNWSGFFFIINAYCLFFYELYHHYQDLFYIFY